MDQLVVDRADLLIAAGPDTAYRAGLTFRLTILTVDDLDAQYEFGFDIAQLSKEGALDLRADVDGVNVDLQLCGGSSASTRRVVFDFWLPIDGPAQLVDRSGLIQCSFLFADCSPGRAAV